MPETCQVTFMKGSRLPWSRRRSSFAKSSTPSRRPRRYVGQDPEAGDLKGHEHELQVSAFVEIGDKIEIDTTMDGSAGG